MIKIEIKSRDTLYVSGTSGKTGKPFAFYKQAGYAHLAGEPYPVRIEMSHDNPEQAYLPGMYQLAPESIYVDRYGSLSLGRIKLIAISTPAARPTAAA